MLGLQGSTNVSATAAASEWECLFHLLTSELPCNWKSLSAHKRISPLVPSSLLTAKQGNSNSIEEDSYRHATSGILRI